MRSGYALLNKRKAPEYPAPRPIFKATILFHQRGIRDGTKNRPPLKMDQSQLPGHPLTATAYTLCSVLCGIFASVGNVEFYVRIVAGLAATGAAFMACRYHWYATKEKIESLKKLKQ